MPHNRVLRISAAATPILLLLFCVILSPQSARSSLQESPATPADPWRPAAAPTSDRDGFISIRGGTFWSGDVVTRKNRQELTRVEDFEMMDHPVTNSEYKKFVDATNFPPPLHWVKNQIPAGEEKHPVVYVNRYDVDAYVQWRTKTENRVYRLPSDAEYEYAARGGLERKLYPWGDDQPTGKANFDETGGKLFDAWRTHLKPVKSYPPNSYGLYDMAGNVWQMTLMFTDPARARFKYRITTQADLEGRIVGGSWARASAYLRCGYGGNASPGIRHPDIGFRVVREPNAGAPSFNQMSRRLIAAAQGPGRVFLSWQLNASDPDGIGFNVYRSTRRDAAGFKVNAQPITSSTNFVDENLKDGVLYYYRVRSLTLDSQQEGFSSEWIGVETGANKTGLIASIKPLPRRGGLVPVFGDLNGDGSLDCIVRFDNGNVEMSRDPGVPVELEAFLGDGRFLWRRSLVEHKHSFGSASDVPVSVYDLDGDGRAEVICRIQEGDEVYLGVLDGMTGRLLRKTPWPPMLTDFAKSSTRIHLSIAYLDGKRPAIVTQTGLYENEVFVAFDADLNKLWEFRSLQETNGSGAHYIQIADVDADGRDEVFDGTTCLNPDGTLRWSIYREHPDVVAIKDFLPQRPGLEVFYAVESSVHAGAYLVDAKTGQIIWKVNREDDPRWTHAHTGWAADIWAGSPGLECFTNRDGHLIKDTVLLSAQGKILTEPFPYPFSPIEWDGDPVRELISRDGRMLGKFDGQRIVPITGAVPNEREKGNCVMVADLAGDFRDEVVVVGPTEEGGTGVFVYTATALLNERATTRTAGHAYRMWMAHNLTGGYGSYFEPEGQAIHKDAGSAR